MKSSYHLEYEETEIDGELYGITSDGNVYGLSDGPAWRVSAWTENKVLAVISDSRHPGLAKRYEEHDGQLYFVHPCGLVAKC